MKCIFLKNIWKNVRHKGKCPMHIVIIIKAYKFFFNIAKFSINVKKKTTRLYRY